MQKNSLVTLPIFKALKPATPTPLRNSLGFGLQILFLVSVGLFLLMGQSPAWKSLVDNVAINFLSVTLEALPFMLVGMLAGGIIEVFIPTLWVDRVFRKNRTRGIFLAGTIGMIFPTCECAIVPVVRRLLGKGVPFPAAITFLLAGPIVNPIVAWSTAVAYTFSWKIVIIRLACGYVIAVLVGSAGEGLRYKTDSDSVCGEKLGDAGPGRSIVKCWIDSAVEIQKPKRISCLSASEWSAC